MDGDTGRRRSSTEEGKDKDQDKEKRKGQLNDEELVIRYRPPLQALRVPVVVKEDHKNDQEEEVVLVFRSNEEREASRQVCVRTVRERCLAGARAGCSVSAMRACGRPWLARLFGGAVTQQEAIERDACEAQALDDCMEAAMPDCQAHAEETCARVYDHAKYLTPSGRLSL